MRKIQIILSMLLISFALVGQKLDVKVKYKDGTSITGIAKPPKANSKFISVKMDNGQVRKILSDELESLEYSKEEFTYLFHRESYNAWVFMKRKMKKAWVHVRYLHPKLNCYYGASQYKIKNKGTILYEINDLGGYFFKRSNEEFMSYMSGSNHSLLKIERKIVTKYFEDKPQLVEKIESGDYAYDQILEIYDSYIGKK